MNREEFAKAVFELVLAINGGAVKRNGNGKPTAFFTFSGHINAIDVDVHPTGWVPNDEPDRFCFRLDFEDDDTLIRKYHKLSIYAAKLWREGDKNVDVV